MFPVATGGYAARVGKASEWFHTRQEAYAFVRGYKAAHPRRHGNAGRKRVGNMVPTDELREARKHCRLSTTEIAGRADLPPRRVYNILTEQKTVHYDLAVSLCRAMDLDPVDVGL